ncbi:BZ3500_MvSof-1268-A1-R1_Chr4-1g06647 [Microbotryum saponariae]|uniref:RecQ-mediated genome instability protein 1 n=1 Tax=Microbotryum saponariae TaxID=289078 RepID=A0A2X0NFA6_9BASI|nr:BZ3500_MvSof-1268-A1-R1_Chr4-1g06647 [Microbotryum saponariae]SDA06312.1 BZ3501_MvSof-1269-A2-R1_Chr4-1g06357 [Microbotryum saponariae]
MPGPVLVPHAHSILTRSNASSFATHRLHNLHSPFHLDCRDNPPNPYTTPPPLETFASSATAVIVASAQIPPSLRPWFASSYSPHFQFDPEWLDACVEYLVEHFPTCSQQPSTLIKKVEEQLLASDLATSTLSPSPLAISTTLSVPPPPTSTDPKRPLFPQKKLVQIISIDEIAYPALGLLETLKDQRSRRESDEAMVEQLSRPGATNDEDDVPTDQDETIARSWPRGLVKLGLSDGYTAVEAFEKRLVRGLGLSEVKLGCKLLLHNVSYTSKFLVLTPETVTIKGSQVPELEQFAEKRLERTLHRRLGLDFPPDPELDIFEPNAPNAIQTLEEDDARSSTEATTMEGDDSLFIDEAAWEEAERKAVEAARAVARERASGGGGGGGGGAREKGNGGDEEGGEDDDVIIID